MASELVLRIVNYKDEHAVKNGDVVFQTVRWRSVILDGTMQSIKEAGVFVLSSATTVSEAKALEAGGADAVIAQGTEAGGHRRTFHG